jgi:hypothetical protein
MSLAEFDNNRHKRATSRASAPGRISSMRLARSVQFMMFSLPHFVQMWSCLSCAIVSATKQAACDRQFDLVWAVLRDELSPFNGLENWPRSRHKLLLVRLVLAGR